MYENEKIIDNIINYSDDIAVSVISKNDYIKIKSGYIKCLSPDVLTDYADSNENSMVLEFSINDMKILFTGDISAEVEEKLELKNYDILKVAHHGSKYSSSIEFLKKTQPKIAFISCGLDNNYGHPSPELIENLNKENIKYYISAGSGQKRIILNR